MAITAEQRAVVLSALEHGESLRAASKLAGLPTHTVWYVEMKRDPGLYDHYAHAREMGYLTRADQLLETAKDMTIPADHKRIIVDTQKWELSKMVKAYGDRVEHTHEHRRTTEALTSAELEQIVKQALLAGSDVSDAVIVDNSPIAPSIAHTHTDPDVSA